MTLEASKVTNVAIPMPSISGNSKRKKGNDFHSMLIPLLGAAGNYFRPTEMKNKGVNN
jgi:hypothetical protein